MGLCVFVVSALALALKCSGQSTCQEEPSADYAFGQCGTRDFNRTVPLMGQRKEGEAYENEFPWSCLLLDKDSPEPDNVLGNCVVVPNNWENVNYEPTSKVLTTAIKIATVDPRKIIVRVGDYKRKSSKNNCNDYQVERIVPHPHFFIGDERLINNIAIVFTVLPIEVKRQNVNSVCFPACSQQFGPASKCWVSGWNEESPDGILSDIIMKADVSLISDVECNRKLIEQFNMQVAGRGTLFALEGGLHSSEICASSPKGEDSCNGFLSSSSSRISPFILTGGGSPLVCVGKSNRWSVVGLVSWGIGCRKVYTSITTFQRWIDETNTSQRSSGRNFEGRRCCTPENPCNEGEGDCDGPGDGGQNDGHLRCKGNLVCGSNNCKKFGAYYHEKDDCCEKQQSVQPPPVVTQPPIDSSFEPPTDAGPCLDLETDDYIFEDPDVIQDCNKNVTCSHYANQGFECAPYYQCQNKDTSPVITSGDGATDIHVDLRHTNLKNEYCVVLEGTLDASDPKCETEGHVCCKDPDVNAIKCDAINNDDVYEKCGRTSVKTKITKLDKKSTGSAQPGEFTHMCVIYRITPEGSQLYHGGASLIGKNKVITVAHKFWVTRTTSSQSVDYRNSPSAFKMRCGEYNVRKEKELIKYQEADVAAMYFHPLYDPTHKFVPNNLVILRTEKNFVYQDHIGPVCLPRPDDKFESDEECFSSGWGKTQFEATGSYSDILKKIGMGIIPHKKCNKELRKKISWLRRFKAHKSMVCVGGETGKDTCTGDGGSPHVCKRDGKWVQVGAVAWGIGCGDGIPAIYASIPDAMCWIDQIMTCVPLAATDINNDEDKDIRGTGDLAKTSVNGLTERECSASVRTQNVPDIGDCRVIHDDYDSVF